MPCVLPVIALKIFGFVNQAKDSPARVRLLGVVYCLGVLTSFVVLAGVVIGSSVSGGGGANSSASRARQWSDRAARRRGSRACECLISHSS